MNLATEKGLRGIVEVLLANPNIDVNKLNTGQKQSVVQIASEVGNTEILRLLLLNPQTFVNNKDANGDSALSWGLRYYGTLDLDVVTATGVRLYFRILKLLMKCPKTEVLPTHLDGIELGQKGEKELGELFAISKELKPTCCIKVKESILNASWVGDFRAIRGLLRCPGSESNVNTVDKKGRTPLYIASMMGHLQAVKVLLQDIHVKANFGTKFDGGTPSSIACEKSHFKVIRALIEYGRSDENKGWCKDKWVLHLSPCNERESLTPVTTPSQTTNPGSGRMLMFVNIIRVL